jgi:hypothetical protein
LKEINTTIVPGVNVTVTNINSAFGVIFPTVATDATGLAQFALPTGAYNIVVG